MKHLLYFATCLIFLSSCSHKIVRTGYSQNKESFPNCEVVIKRSMYLTENMEKVGEIKLGETGFSTTCNEARAIEILQKEACSLNADIINIIDEKRPDAMSTCYRCRAEFYRYTNREVVQKSDEFYNPGYITHRVANDKKNNTTMIVTGVIVGLLVGFLSAL